VNSVTDFYAGGYDVDANDPITTATGLDIAPQKVTGVTNGVGIRQEGTNDFNYFNAYITSFGDGSNLSFGTTTGTKFGTGTNQKIGFYNYTPVVQPSGDILAALGTASGLGLISSPTIGGNDVNPAVTISNGGNFGYSSNSTAPNFVTNGGFVKGSAVIPANKLVVGSTYRLTMAGYYSTSGTPTLTLIWGTYNSGLASTFGSTSAITMPSTVSNLEWQAQYTFTVETTGTSGTLFGQGWADIETSGGAMSRYAMPNATPVSVNTTVNNWLMGYAQWGTASPSNTLTCTNATIEQIY
jgi:hypothetical protein